MEGQQKKKGRGGGRGQGRGGHGQGRGGFQGQEGGRRSESGSQEHQSQSQTEQFFGQGRGRGQHRGQGRGAQGQGRGGHGQGRGGFHGQEGDRSESGSQEYQSQSQTDQSFGQGRGRGQYRGQGRGAQGQGRGGHSQGRGGFHEQEGDRRSETGSQEYQSQSQTDQSFGQGRGRDQNRGQGRGAQGQGRGGHSQGRGGFHEQEGDRRSETGSQEYQFQSQPEQSFGQGRGRGQHQGQGRGAQGQGRGGQDQGRSGSEMRPQEQPQPQISTQQPSSHSSIQHQGQGDGPKPLESSISKLQITDTKGVELKFGAMKPGTVGRKIRVETNYLSLNLGKLKVAYHYDVNIVPDLPKNCLRTVMEIFRKNKFPQRYPAFDGRKNLYSGTPLPFNGVLSDTIKIQVDDREKEYKVEVKFANEVDLSPLHDINLSMKTPSEALQCVDIALRNAPAKNLISVGRNFFSKPAQIIDLGEGMQMYHGFYQSATRGWKPFLNVDVAHKAFPIAQPVLESICQVYSNFRQTMSLRDLERGLNRTEDLARFITQLKICYEIPGNIASRRVYRVNGIKGTAANTRFKLDNGQEMTIMDYFAKEKKYRIKYPHLPLLWVGNRNRNILLPAELCTVMEGQAVNRKMTENQTSAMIKQAATDTGTRKAKIMNAVTRANHNNDDCVRKEFGFSVGNKFEELDARVLPPPKLEYADRMSVVPRKGVWQLHNPVFFKGASIMKWTIAVADRMMPRNLEDVARMIFAKGRQSGVIGAEATRPFEQIGGGRVDMRSLTSYMEKRKDMDIIFIVVGNFEYGLVKKAAELSIGCLTQCIKSRTLNRVNEQIIGNILLKVNSKMNGTNHFLSSRPPILNVPCMIMGADVTHPPPESQTTPSVAAVTASHDPKAFQYNICWRLQPPKVEIIEDLQAIVREQLLYFYKKNNGQKPQRIVFFRDGVSEGQFEQVKAAELQAIRNACGGLQQDYKPSITFLVVQKRHHTRLFPMNPNDSEDRNCNVPAGTCVDTHITHPFMQDFYLVSHASIQGVAKPTKYCTLWDDNNLSNDEIELLAYYLCHLFTRCNRSVSYPAPTYYAHLAAARAKIYVDRENLNLNDLQREQLRFKIQSCIQVDKPMFFV